MKYSGIVSLALSALVAASPTAPPAKFALQVTANGETLFLSKAGDGSGVTDKAQAAACSIAGDTLSCNGKTIGVNARMGSYKSVDMAPIAPATSKAITKGFSVDASNNLHFKNDAEFQGLGGYKGITGFQGGEAKFGLFKSTLLTGGKSMVYFQLGCPGGSHNGLHDVVYVGTAQAIPL